MLDQSILEIAIATCFSSPALAKKLKADLLTSAGLGTLDRADFAKKCREELHRDLDDDYPRRFRRNDIEQAIQVVWHDNMLCGAKGAAMPYLDQLYECLFIAHGDQIQYRDGQVQAYARLAARIDPAVLVAWRLAQRIREEPSLYAHDLLRLLAAQQPFFAPLAIAGKAVADNHVHVGGVLYAGMALMAGLLPSVVEPSGDKNRDASPAKTNKRRRNKKAENRNESNKPKNSTKANKLDPGQIELQHLAQSLLLAENLLPFDEHLGEKCSPKDQHRAQDLFNTESEAVVSSAAIRSRVYFTIRSALGAEAQVAAPNGLPWDCFVLQAETVRADNPRWLRQQIARCIVAQDLGQAWLWFLLWLWLHYQHPQCDARLRMAIFYLLNRLMAHRRALIMDGQGLSRFIEYNGHPKRKAPDDAAALGVAKTLFQGSQDVAELKVMERKFQPEKIAEWIGHLARGSGFPALPCLGLPPIATLPQYRAMMERWHYCIHFSRGKHFLHAPEKVWEHARDIQNKLNQQSGWDVPAMLGATEAVQLDANGMPIRLLPSRWLRGLDVAGDENLTKIEIYAPALRWLREGMRSKHANEVASDGLHLSIHAGEDYAHPLSGMRHIDETVQFCEMRAGDRLGHALAIGILASDWVKAHGEILLPVEEHVDNLVWAWHYASLMASRFMLAAQVLPILERRILKNLVYVPWAHGGCMMMEKEVAKENQPKSIRHCASAERIQAITPENLYQAWLLRRNCSFKLKQYETSEIKNRESNVALPDRSRLTTCCEQDQNVNHQGQACKTTSGRYPPDVMLYRQRWKWLEIIKNTQALENKGCDKLGTRTTVRIRLERDVYQDFTAGSGDPVSHLIEDSHSLQELEFFDALQDFLLNAYDQKGLVIETNPTSNVYIARLHDHAEHPIFRWYPPNEDWLKPGERHNRFGLRRGPIKVCVNTDDPGIMPTTLRTEFALLREAAMQHGVTRTDAEDWVERLRLFGLNEFRQKHQSVWVAKRA